MWMATRYNTVEQAALVHRHHAQEPKGGTRFVDACSTEGGVLHFPNHGDVVVTQHVEPVVMGPVQHSLLPTLQGSGSHGFGSGPKLLHRACPLAVGRVIATVLLSRDFFPPFIQSTRSCNRCSYLEGLVGCCVGKKHN